MCSKCIIILLAANVIFKSGRGIAAIRCAWQFYVNALSVLTRNDFRLSFFPSSVKDRQLPRVQCIKSNELL